ncbi:MAG: hypothetical protein ACRC80_19080 [Waterburya sp.]
MTWVKKSFKFSLILLLLTYAAEGWMYGAWITKQLEEGVLLTQLTEQMRLGIFYITAIAAISFFVIIFTSPISLFTIGLNGWLKSDTRAFLSIFVGAFAVTMVFQWVDFFARFLVLTAAALLFKLDLQLSGCNRWLCSLILIILCWLGFTGGILAFYNWRL